MEKKSQKPYLTVYSFLEYINIKDKCLWCRVFHSEGGGTPPPNQNWCPPLWKSTINNNLKSSSNPWKICLKKFIFSKFGGLQACSRQFYHQMNSFPGIFWQYFKLPHAPPCFDLSPSHQILRSPPMFATPAGNPVVQ